MLVKAGACKRVFACKAHEMLRVPHFSKRSDRAANNRFLAVATNAFEKFEVVWITIQFAFILVAIATTELTSTLFTAVMLWMHSLALNGDIFANNRLFALSAYSCRRFNNSRAPLHAHKTVRFSLVFFEGFCAEFSTTTSAIEALWME
jgi:hypothetical protein